MTADLSGQAEGLARARVAGWGVSWLQPFWSAAGVWAVACGALAGGQGLPGGAALVSVSFLVLLVSLGWIPAWQLLTDIDWFHPLRTGWPPRRPAVLPTLPFTRPHSPAGRLWRAANGLVGWWRETLWPAVGGALLGLAAAVVVAAVFSLLLSGEDRPGPDGVRWLSAAFIALAGVGLLWRRHGRDWPAGQALACVGLPWLAGHLAVAEPAPGSALLALAFTLAVWGVERLARGLRGGGWLLVAAQAGAVALLVVLQQPLPAGAAGALVLVQLGLLPAVVAGADPARAARRTRLWLVATMLLAAVGLP